VSRISRVGILTSSHDHPDRMQRKSARLCHKCYLTKLNIKTRHPVLCQGHGHNDICWKLTTLNGRGLAMRLSTHLNKQLDSVVPNDAPTQLSSSSYVPLVVETGGKWRSVRRLMLSKNDQLKDSVCVRRRILREGNTSATLRQIFFPCIIVEPFISC